MLRPNHASRVCAALGIPRVRLEPFFREIGAGPGVVCIHSNASSSSQWRTLMERLAPMFHVLAADSFGSGKSPAWPDDRPLHLRDEVELLEPVFNRAGASFALVGHSYGAAVALRAAVKFPHRVSGLALYEPTLFALLDAHCPPPNAADGIRGAVGAAVAALRIDDPSEAARCIVDFWGGNGAWYRTPEQRRKPIMDSIALVPSWTNALFNEPTSLQEFSGLQVPVLYMIGKDSPSSSRGVAKLLTQALPRVEVVEFEGLGHMGPVTHPETVNETVCRFLEHG